MDFTHFFNTPIPEDKQKDFNAWLVKNPKAKNDYYDYDVQGYWLSGAGQDSRGHGSDRFKKPNHPTFSVESQYSTPDRPGGQWLNGAFMAHPSNLVHHTPEDLQSYFKQVEPDTHLYLPSQAPGPAQAPQPQMQQVSPLISILQQLLGHAR